MFGTGRLSANGTVNTPLDQWEVSAAAFASVEMEKEYEAIKSNGCSLAYTPVTKGTEFLYIFHLFFSFFFFGHKEPHESVCDFHFCIILDFHITGFHDVL